MRKPSLPTPLTRPIGWRAAAAVIAGAPTGALVGALVVLGALPLLGQGTRRGEHAAHRPAATTTTAARLMWLAIAAALGRWLAEGVLNPEMGLEGIGWMAILPLVLVAAAGLTMAAQGLLRRRGWARWTAVVAFSLLGTTALAGLVDWTGALMRSRADGRWPIPAERVAVDLATPVLFLAISIGASCCSRPQPPGGISDPAASSRPAPTAVALGRRRDRFVLTASGA